MIPIERCENKLKLDKEPAAKDFRGLLCGEAIKVPIKIDGQARFSAMHDVGDFRGSRSPSIFFDTAIFSSLYTQSLPLSHPGRFGVIGRRAAGNMAKSLLSKVLNTLQIKVDYFEKPAGLRWRSNTFFIVATVAVGLFTELFLYSLIVPVLPFMLQDRVGIPQDEVQSYVSGLLTAYAAASVVSSPFAGIMADRLSTRQAPFLAGVAIMFLATAGLYIGDNIPILVVARILQGRTNALVARLQDSVVLPGYSLHSHHIWNCC